MPLNFGKIRKVLANVTVFRYNEEKHQSKDENRRE